MGILVPLILPTHEHSVFFHVFVSSSVSFANSWFLLYQCFTFLVKIIPKYFVILNEILFHYSSTSCWYVQKLSDLYIYFVSISPWELLNMNSLSNFNYSLVDAFICLESSWLCTCFGSCTGFLSFRSFLEYLPRALRLLGKWTHFQ